MEAPFTLFGTVTSPFVRRVRIVALELQRPFDLVDTNSAEGGAQLRAASPVWKVPTARFADGLVAWDSRVIVDHLCRSGWGPLRAPSRMPRAIVEEENTVNAVDEALLSLVRLFYLKKDGAPVDAPFLRKERARADNVLAWLEGRVSHGRYLGPAGEGQGLGRAELAALTALSWIRFRNMADLAAFPRLDAMERAWCDRPSVAETLPPG